MIPGNANPLLLATAAADGAAADVATKSLRFNSGDSAYLNRTFSSAGNRKKWTWSGWLKRTGTGTNCLFSAQGSSNHTLLLFYGSTQKLAIVPQAGSAGATFQSNAVHRDPSAWYHFVIALDTTQSTESNRLKAYKNGVEITWSSSTYPSQNEEWNINFAGAHNIGRSTQADSYLDGYLADVHFIDGSQLEPTSFGAFDDNGVWQAAEYSGTFGTNGFHLKFNDASSNAALGTDGSGNGNNFTVNNLVASAPATAKGGFDVVTYTGTGSTQSISGLKFQPDFVWIKQRDASRFNVLFDSVRGANERLISNSTAAESTQTDHLSAFTSDGFTVQTSANVNVSSGSYVAWAWKAGGAAVSNTDGSITSSVSASTDYGFSIVSYTGTGANATIGHGLNTAPAWIIIKNRDSNFNDDDWRVWHSSLAANERLVLSGTNIKGSASTLWQNTLPTSTKFYLDSDQRYNANGDDHIAYCWSEIPGFSSFGSYEGDGDGTGPDVTTGFKPKYVIIKNIDEASGWRIYDSVRGDSKVLKPNTSTSELTTGDPIVFLSDGFRLTGTANEETNKSGMTYIYAAFSGEPPGDLVDSLFDAPTNGSQSDTGAGGEVSGCYATLNPLQKGSTQTLSNGNLDFSGSGGHGHTFSTIGMSSGKFYCEYTAGNTYAAVGIALGDSAVINAPIGDNPGSWGYVSNGSSSTKQADPPSSHTSYGSAVVSGDIVGIAFDADNGTLEFYKNGTSMGVAYTGISTGYTYHFIAGDSTSAGTPTGTMNFGQRKFAYAAPSNYKALCTTNLPTATVPDGSDYFDVDTYTGTGSSHERSEFSFSPDFVWIKARSTTQNHKLFDIVRGAGKELVSNSAGAEATDSNQLSSFDSDGFTVGSGLAVNQSSQTFCAWAWDGGTSTASNTDGSITSSVRANASAGFSILTATTPSSGTSTYGHSLNSAPEFLIVKIRGSSSNWYIYHSALGNTKSLKFTTDAAGTTANIWNDTSPTSSVFTLGTDWQGSYDFVAYCFAPVAGYSAFGEYTGNGSSSDGPFVYTGFRPRWLMVKQSSAGINDWQIIDTARSEYNAVDVQLFANNNNAELTNSTNRDFDLLSNGFKIRGNNGGVNADTATYIWAAFAENPLQANGGLAR